MQWKRIMNRHQVQAVQMHMQKVLYFYFVKYYVFLLLFFIIIIFVSNLLKGEVHGSVHAH